MAAPKLAKAVAVTAASLCLGGCAAHRNVAEPLHNSSLPRVASASRPEPDKNGASHSQTTAETGILSKVPDRPEPQPGTETPPAAGGGRPGWDEEGKPIHVENLFSKEYGKLLISDVGEVLTSPLRWRTKEWVTFSVVGGTVAGFTFLDNSIRDFMQSHRANPSDTFAKNVAPLGATYSAGILGSFYLVGVIWDKPHARAVAQDGLAASVITSFMIVPAMKASFGRSRPDQDHGAKDFDPFNIGQSSFPSGHTAQAFTVATVIATHYDSWWVKIGSFGAASLVGWARVHKDRHYTSDCLAGAAIGTFVGYTVTRYNQRHRAKAGESKTTFAPYYDGQAGGLTLNRSF
jgi:membrane-associated phospholipid phosphatase